MLLMRLTESQGSHRESSKGVRVLRHAEQRAPRRIRNDLFVRDMVADQLRQARRDAGPAGPHSIAWWDAADRVHDVPPGAGCIPRQQVFDTELTVPGAASARRLRGGVGR